MSSEVLELSEGVLRQRRNLMATTLLIIFINLAGVEFNDQMKFMGASFSITNPNFIHQFVLIAQAYFLWRFYQYFYHDKVSGALKSQYQTQIRTKQDEEVLSQIFKKLPEGVSSIASGHTFSDLQKLDSSAGVYKVEVSTPRVGADTYDKHLIEVSRKVIDNKKFPVVFSFAFRGRIITDFYLPLFLVVLSVPMNFV